MLNVDKGLAFKPGWRYALSYLVVQYGQVGVAIFFVISGYFLVRKRFNWTRIFKTWFQMFCYGILVFAIIFICALNMRLPGGISDSFHGDNLITTLVWTFLPFFFGSYWFITAYICMLLLSPFLNALFDNLSERYIDALIGLLAIFGIWMLFFDRGKAWDNVTYAVLGYLIGGWIRNYADKHSKILRTRNLVFLIILFTICMAVFNHVSASGVHVVQVLGWQNQIKDGIQVLPMIIGAAIFILVNRIDMSHMPHGLETFTLKLAASSFGVYLLHENMFLYRLIWPTVAGMFPVPHSSLSKIAIFVACVLIVYAAASLVAFLLDTLIVHPLERTIRILQR